MSHELPAERAPVLRVVRGEPGLDEIAALVTVLGARASGDSAPAPAKPRSAWNAPSRLVRRPVAPGLGGWRRSALPS